MSFLLLFYPDDGPLEIQPYEKIENAIVELVFRKRTKKGRGYVAKIMYDSRKEDGFVQGEVA